MTNGKEHTQHLRLPQVFLDVGANTGQSLAPAQEWGFDEIHCFEPAPTCWPRLQEIADPHTTVIHHFGLWDRDARAELIDAGGKGASLWKKTNWTDRGYKPALCDFVRASTWFRENLVSPATVFLKLNCEGAECDILDDLLDSGEFEKVTYMMVDFDVRKIKDLQHRQEEILRRLAPYPPPRVLTSRTAMVGATHRERTLHWLRLCTSQDRPPA
jgi:FkbM family methyltransferase